MLEILRKLLFQIPWLGAKLRRWHLESLEYQHLNIGEYSSPIASEETIAQHARIKLNARRKIPLVETDLPAMDLNLAAQTELLEKFSAAEMFSPDWIKRYQRDNDFYQQMDAFVLNAMISHFRPNKILEIGSGFSTLAILDSLEANDLKDTKLCLIEPHPERLLENIEPQDRERFELLSRPLQNNDLTLVKELMANDLLLVDSSHIYKVGSDVQILFETFYPQLSNGVLLHIHDIFFPFDYPASWLRRGDHMNEAYVLRSFLQFNRSFDILLWNDLMKHLENAVLPAQLDFGDEDLTTSIWLQRNTGP